MEVCGYISTLLRLKYKLYVDTTFKKIPRLKRLLSTFKVYQIKKGNTKFTKLIKFSYNND